jgi:hypothetical protein
MHDRGDALAPEQAADERGGFERDGNKRADFGKPDVGAISRLSRAVIRSQSQSGRQLRASISFWAATLDRGSRRSDWPVCAR